MLLLLLHLLFSGESDRQISELSGMGQFESREMKAFSSKRGSPITDEFPLMASPLSSLEVS